MARISHRLAASISALVLGSLLVLALPSTASELEIRGRVLSADERPLAGAELLLLPHPDAARLAELQREGRFEPPPVAQTRSAEDGSFRLLAPEPGFWKLIARHPDHLDAADYLNPLLDDTELAPVALPARREIAVRVVATDGSPIAGVQVVGRGWSDAWTAARERGWWPHHCWGTTGADGIARLATGEGAQLSVAAVFGERFGFTRQPPGGGEITLVLDHPLRRLRLVDSTGRPVAGATAVVGWPFLDLGTSDEKGLLAVPEPAAGLPLNLLRGLLVEGLPAPTPAPTPSHAADAVPTLALPAAEPFDLQIIDALSRLPVTGAFVWGNAGHRRADAKGRARLELPPGRALQPPVIVGAPGYIERQLGKVERLPGSREPIVVRLAPALALGGRVLDPEGQPVAGAELTVGLGTGATAGSEGWLRNPTAWPAPVTTDTEGRFRIARLAPGVAYRVEVRRKGFAPRQVEIPPLDPATPAAPVEITLEPGITVFGHVVDEHEQPIANAEVSLATRRSGDFGRWRRAEPIPFEATTDAQGRFLLSDLSTGPAALFVRADGFAELTVPGLELAPATAPVDLGVVQLERGATLEGKVVDAEDRPLAGAEVSLQRLDFGGRATRSRRHGALPPVTTDTGGRFRFDTLPKTAVLHLHVQHRGFQSRTLEGVRPAVESQLVVVLEPAAAVTAVVVDGSGTAVAGAEVTLVQTAEGGWNSQGRNTEGDGRATFDGLPAGEVTLSARAEAGAAPPRKVMVAAGGAPAEVRLELLPAAVLGGRVVDADGEPVAGVMVSAEVSGAGEKPSPQLGARAYARSADDGRFLLSGLEAGGWHVTAWHATSEPAFAEVTLAAGEVQEIEIVLDGHGAKNPRRVTGRVLGSAGQPLAGALVRLVAVEGHRELDRATSAADGRFELRAPTASTFEVSAYLPGAGSGRSDPFALAPGEARDLEVVLGAGNTIAGRILGLELAELGAVQISAYAGDGMQIEAVVRHDGSYRLASLPAGEWRLAAVTPRLRFNAPEPVVLTGDGEVVEIDLPLGAGRPLHGRVWKGDQPAEGVSLVLGCSNGVSNDSTTSRYDGSFWLDVPPAPCQLQVNDPRSGLSLQLAIDTSSGTAGPSGSLVATDPATGTELRVELEP